MTGIIIPDGGTIGSASDTDAISVSSSGAVTLSSDFVPATPLSHRNMIINGAMQVAQRGTSESSLSGTTSGYKNAPDRFRFALRNCGTFTVSQSTEAPEGFKNSYKIDCTTADTSLDANSYLIFGTRLEGQDLVRLKKGTSNAESFTVSFYVRSSVTGTYVLEIQDEDNQRHIAKTYTIDSANTWERKSLTFAGDTSDPLTYDNTLSVELTWSLARGTDYTSGTLATSWADKVNGTEAGGLTVNLGSSTSNDWHITGVQLELGSVATPFEHRSYEDELKRCFRYFERYTGPNIHGGLYASNAYLGSWFYKARKRTRPTISGATGAESFTANNSSTGYEGGTDSCYFQKDSGSLYVTTCSADAEL